MPNSAGLTVFDKPFACGEKASPFLPLICAALGFPA
jgi:hypothetical protein